MTQPSRDEVLRIAEVATHHVDEGRVALGGPDRGEMAQEPDCGAYNPEAQAKPHGRGERAVTIATARGAPPSRIGSVKARWTGA
jgi:hypothetical protein